MIAGSGHAVPRGETCQGHTTYDCGRRVAMPVPDMMAGRLKRACGGPGFRSSSIPFRQCSPGLKPRLSGARTVRKVVALLPAPRECAPGSDRPTWAARSGSPDPRHPFTPRFTTVRMIRPSTSGFDQRRGRPGAPVPLVRLIRCVPGTRVCAGPRSLPHDEAHVDRQHPRGRDPRRGVRR